MTALNRPIKIYRDVINSERIHCNTDWFFSDDIYVFNGSKRRQYARDKQKSYEALRAERKPKLCKM